MIKVTHSDVQKGFQNQSLFFGSANGSFNFLSRCQRDLRRKEFLLEGACFQVFGVVEGMKG